MTDTPKPQPSAPEGVPTKASEMVEREEMLAELRRWTDRESQRMPEHPRAHPTRVALALIEAQSAEIAELRAARDQYAGFYMDRVGQLNEANCALAAAQDRVARLTSVLMDILPTPLLPDSEHVSIDITFGKIKRARQALADTGTEVK